MNWIKRLFRKKPQRQEPSFFWSLYRDKKELDDMRNYCYERWNCGDIIDRQPSKMLRRRYGRNIDPIIWSILEDYFDGKLIRK